MADRANSVSEYIQQAPEKYKVVLEELRKLILSLVPEAKERISYGMPFFDYKGRLVYFALQKNFIGLYIPPPIIENHKKDLLRYTTTKSSVHIPLDKPLPIPLITTLIKARVRYNESI